VSAIERVGAGGGVGVGPVVADHDVGAQRRRHHALLGAVEQAVVVAVGIERVDQAVAVGVGGVAGSCLVADAVVVAVIVVGIGAKRGLLGVAQAVAVAVAGDDRGDHQRADQVRLLIGPRGRCRG
jgi:hypothetical protein